jgi:hypothetical protein
MIEEIPGTRVTIPEISQIAFAVEDLYDGMDRFGSILGIDEWEVYRFEPPTLSDQRHHDEEVDNSHRIAVTYPEDDDIMIELMDPLSEPNLYSDFLEEHSEGMHHFACFEFDDHEGVVERFEDAGIPVLQYGKFAETEFWYFDTQDVLNGATFEIVKNPYPDVEPNETYS